MALLALRTKDLFPMIAFSGFIKIFAVIILTHLPISKVAAAPESFADLADQLLPTVVNISSTQKPDEQPVRKSPFQSSPHFPGLPDGHPFNDFFDDFFDRHFHMVPPKRESNPAASLGSGFIIDKEKGLIITNNHVIDDADEIKITLHNDKILPAEVIGTDEKTDLAVLKADLNSENVSEARFGNSDDMRVGDWIIAIGNPFGLGGTVTAGIISARQRDIQSGPYDDYIQTDASINRGNSGGPMFNTKGEVIGINTAIFSPTGGSVGIGFAIPSVLAESVVKQLAEFGRTKRGWLGVKIQAVTDEIADSLGLKKAAGALVADISPTGPAEKAGIQSGDIILAFDNKPIREMRHLPRIVAETDIDKKVDVVVWRNGKRLTLNVDIGQLEKAEDDGLLEAHNQTNDSLDDDNSSQGTEVEKLGLVLSPLDQSLREEFDFDSDMKGLVVIEADLSSDAAKKGIDVGDVITDVNQRPVQSIDMLEAEIERAEKMGRESILLLVNRRGSIQFVAVKLTSEEDKE